MTTGIPLTIRDETLPLVVVLFSGGLDSTVLLHVARNSGMRPIAVSIAYGQRNARELSKAMETCTRLNIEQHMMVLGLGQINSALTGPQQRGKFGNVSEWYVPNRNFIFAGMAAAFAEAEGINRVWYGANKDSIANGFPDCSPDWIDKVNAVLATGLSRPVRLEAPLINLTKEQVRVTAIEYGIDMAQVHSGYDV